MELLLFFVSIIADPQVFANKHINISVGNTDFEGAFGESSAEFGRLFNVDADKFGLNKGFLIGHVKIFDVIFKGFWKSQSIVMRESSNIPFDYRQENI